MEDQPKSQVLVTDKIRRSIRTVLTKENVPNDLREQLRKYASSRRSTDNKGQRMIPFELVQVVYDYLKTRQEEIQLHELLEGSDVILPEVDTPVRDPELEARIQKLKAEAANREYAEMTKNVDAKQLKENKFGTVAAEVKTLNNQLIAVANFLITVIGAFVFGYKATEYSLDVPSVPMQLCVGLVLSTIVFFADLYFLVKTTS